MSEIFTIVSYWVATLLLLVLYVVLISDIFPRLFLKMRCAVKDNLGRGLKKFVFPTGRAVLYEPHPSMRKYIKKYLLFVNNGYKYLRCSFDYGVRAISYTVVMLDNKDRVIDAISVSEDMNYEMSSANVQLHQDTSYVAVIVNSVNGRVSERTSVYNRFTDILTYFFSVVVASIVVLFAAKALVSELVYETFDTSIESGIGVGNFFLFGLAIGAALVFIYLMGASRRGIKVIFNEKK